MSQNACETMSLTSSHSQKAPLLLAPIPSIVPHNDVGDIVSQALWLDYQACKIHANILPLTCSSWKLTFLALKFNIMKGHSAK